MQRAPGDTLLARKVCISGRGLLVVCALKQLNLHVFHIKTLVCAPRRASSSSSNSKRRFRGGSAGGGGGGLAASREFQIVSIVTPLGNSLSLSRRRGVSRTL